MGWFNTLPGQLRGIFWMFMQAVFFAAMSAVVHQLGRTMPALEIVFFRSFFGLAVLVPWLLRTGASAFRAVRPGMVLLRNLAVFFAVLVWFTALASRLPISDSIALQFTLSLFVVLGAGIFLRESVGWRRWVAVGVGFLGVLVIIRPGFAHPHPAMFLVLLSAVIYAAAHLLTKVVSASISGPKLVFQMNLTMMPLALACALPGGVMPRWADAPWLIALGVISSVAHICLTRAYAAADASFVEPVDFSRLPLAALYGWVLFGETSDLWTWAGAALIFGAVVYNTRHETRRQKP
jgi:drug/metabolite transporter (DMT)-like permease